MAEVLAGLSIELPQDAVLADREQQVLVAVVDEHALEDDVEIERFAGRVLKVPGQLAGIDIERQRRAACRARRRSTDMPRLIGIHGLACAVPQ